MDEHLVIHARGGHRRLGFLHARQHSREHAQPAHALHLLQLHAQVFEVELALGHFLGERFGLVGLDRLGSLLDEADDVAHAEDTAGHALGIERLDRIELLARTGKLDRLARDIAHRQRRTATRIAVHAGQHHAGQRHFAGKALRHIDRVLPGQAVDHQQHFGRRRYAGDGLHLGHQRFIDMEAARGIEQQHVGRLQLGAFHRPARDIDRLLALDDRECGHLDLFAEHLELFLRGRTVDVQRGHHGLFAVLFLEQLAQLGGGGGLARTLQADHHDHDRRLGSEIEFAILGVGVFTPAEHGDQFIVDDLDDLLAGRDRLEHVLADRLLGHRVDETADNRQRDIGLEQRDAYLAHRFAHVVFRQRAAPLEAIEHIAEAVGQIVEHDCLNSLSNHDRPD